MESKRSTKSSVESCGELVCIELIFPAFSRSYRAGYPARGKSWTYSPSVYDHYRRVGNADSPEIAAHSLHTDPTPPASILHDTFFHAQHPHITQAHAHHPCTQRPHAIVVWVWPCRHHHPGNHRNQPAPTMRPMDPPPSPATSDAPHD